MDMQLVYVNAATKNPVECNFEFPIEENSVVTKLIAEIDEKIVEAQI